jgi:hypothetical protein
MPARVTGPAPFLGLVTVTLERGTGYNNGAWHRFRFLAPFPFLWSLPTCRQAVPQRARADHRHGSARPSMVYNRSARNVFGTSMPNEVEMRRLVDAELATVSEPSRRAALEAVFVPPRLLTLKWGYGKPGEQLQCWLVGLSPNGKERLIYCEKGFGPADPWGFVGSTDDWMGMDCQWHVGLEHAAIGAGILPAPADYEVP